MSVAASVLREMSLDALRLCWRAQCKGDPPLHCSRDLLVRAILYQQETTKSANAVRRAQRRLEQAVAAPVLSAPRRLSPGTVLVREWNGAPYAVTVTSDGFLWEGRAYASLSAVASAITGVRWNGPRFFKLNEAIEKRTP